MNRKELEEALREDMAAINQKKIDYTLARQFLELKIREQLLAELDTMRGELDLLVRKAYDKGATKAMLCRALATKDYHSVYESLERTANV